ECQDRHGANFVECDVARQTGLLDLIAFPDRAPEELEAGVAFFTFFRDLTAAGFWSSRMGVEDLGYTGNRAVMGWTGCPPEVLAHVGLTDVAES
ncbi:MAG: gluconate 2-dehydrogenase subunit 3 family protein, partial [Longimicrobiales bacterium]